MNKTAICLVIGLAGALILSPSPARAQNLSNEALAQSPDLASEALPQAPTTASSSNATGYTFPSGKVRFHHYLWNTLGPLPILQAGFAAGIAQANNTVPDWGQGGLGFGRRYGTAFGVNAIQNSVQEGFSAVLHQDTIYYQCECKGFLPRLGHALISSFTARARDGHRVISVPKFGAPYAGSLTSLTWFPDRYGPKDALRLGTYAFAGNIATNVLREFIWPFHKRHR